MEHELSRRYYFDGPEKEFPTSNAAQRHAEWKLNCMKESWEEVGKFVSAKLLRGKNYFQVEVTYTT